MYFYLIPIMQHNSSQPPVNAQVTTLKSTTARPMLEDFEHYLVSLPKNQR